MVGNLGLLATKVAAKALALDRLGTQPKELLLENEAPRKEGVS